MSDDTLADVMDEFCDQEQLHRNEGRQGWENLCRLVNRMGYVDTWQHFGQFHQQGSVGDLLNFLEDNPGCIEAIKEWIVEQNIPEWKENLLAELLEKEPAEEE